MQTSVPLHAVAQQWHVTMRSVVGRSGYSAILPTSTPANPLQAVDELAAVILDEAPELLWTSLATVDLNHWGMLGTSLTVGPTFGDALSSLGRYLRLLTGERVLKRQLLDEGLHVIVQTASDRPLARAGVCLLFSTIGRTLLGSTTTDNQHQLRAIRVMSRRNMPSTCRDIARRALGCQILDGEPHDALVLPSAAVNSARPTCVACALPPLPPLPELLDEWPTLGPLGRRVCASVIERLLRGIPHMTAVAANLGMSVPALARELDEEKTTFFTLRERTLEAAVTYRLRHSDLPTLDVAFLSGFIDYEVFEKTTQRWFGTSAERFRVERTSSINDAPS